MITITFLMDVPGRLAQPILIFLGSHLDSMVTCVCETYDCCPPLWFPKISSLYQYSNMILSLASSVIAPGSWRQILLVAWVLIFAAYFSSAQLFPTPSLAQCFSPYVLEQVRAS